MSIKDLMKGPDALPAINKRKAIHPKGWEPHVEEAKGTATVVTQPIEGNPDHAELLAASDLSPDEWHIVGDVQVRRWQQTADGPWLRYFKFTARSGKPHEDPEFDAACKALVKHKPKKHDAKKLGGEVIVCLSDLQIGKGEGGGSVAFVERFVEKLDGVAAHVRSLRPERIVIAGMGDIIEQCNGGHYSAQLFTTDLNDRQQDRLARRVILATVKALAPLAPKVTMVSTPGNHGANRNSAGKSVTDPGDNRDVAVFEAVAEALAMSPAYQHVVNHIPEHEQVVVLEIGGMNVAFTHGHLFGGGANAMAKAEKWWAGQCAGGLPAGDAELLISAHYHHAITAEMFGRLWIQCPAMDGGSGWFTNQTGQHSKPGIMTVYLKEGEVELAKVI